MAITHKSGALDTLAAGDRICWHAGAGYSAWGTVTGVREIHTVPGVNGPVFTGITVTVDVAHFPTFDKWGWPTSEPRTVARRFDRFGSDVEWAYTPELARCGITGLHSPHGSGPELCSGYRPAGD